MSDDDPVERFVEDTFDGVDEDDGEPSVPAPKARDMEAELRERTGVGGEIDASDLEVDSDTATAFWTAVVYVNLGILLLAVGPTVYAIRGLPLVSAGLFVAGLYLLYRAYSVYRRFEDRDRDAEGTEGTDDDEEPADDARDGESTD